MRREPSSRLYASVWMTWEQNPLTSDARAVWGTATAGKKIRPTRRKLKGKNHRPANYNLRASRRARAKKRAARVRRNTRGSTARERPKDLLPEALAVLVGREESLDHLG